MQDDGYRSLIIWPDVDYIPQAAFEFMEYLPNVFDETSGYMRGNNIFIPLAALRSAFGIELGFDVETGVVVIRG